ncbi:acyl-CoA dehydrogenase family protein [Streptomyces sp. NPDC050534]|uniref:acyl-CoA dehydrogenase family protein n=1 Tax=Streptomyces sp. NPDC050534 TaxID=3365625 RepID=UPI0037B39A77
MSDLPTELVPPSDEQRDIVELARATGFTLPEEHGGGGSTDVFHSRQSRIGQWTRDAELEEIEEGTSDVVRLVIARSL